MRIPMSQVGNHETFGGHIRRRTLRTVLLSMLRRCYNGYDWRDAKRKSDETYERRDARRELRKYTDGRRVL